MEAAEVIKRLKDKGLEELTLDLKFKAKGGLNDGAKELIKAHKQELIDHLAPTVHCIPNLPWQLKNLLRANSSNTLSVSIDGVTNIKNYVYAYVCDYLLGDRERALEVLFKVYNVWQKQLNQIQKKGNK